MAGRSLAVIPNDPLEAWERAGYISWLPGYFNPTGMFDRVYIVSPREPEGAREAHGMTVVGAPAPRFADALREISPDVIRAYNADWAADLLARSRPREIPALASVHNIPPNPVHTSLQCMDTVICISEIVRTAVLRVGVPRERTANVPNRVDTGIFRPIRDESEQQALSSQFPEGHHVLFVGRKTEQKNLDTLLEAMTHLPPDYHLVLIGQGDENRYVRRAEMLGVGGRCHWISRVPNTELPRWYSWCDCFCVPSRWEGFGIVFIEAAACGAPIVTSDIAPMNEYLVDGESASLVRAYEHPGALSEAIRKTCEDEDYRQRISAGARELSRRFDRERVEAVEAAVYEQALSMGPPDDARWAEIMRWRRRDTLLRPLRWLAPRRVARGLIRRTRAALGGTSLA
ncbi:MAG: glycosyltransferase family 4 protein [Armatimonadota bacterium]